MRKEEPAGENFAPGADLENNFFKHWTESYRKMYQAWMESPTSGTGANPLFSGFQRFSKPAATTRDPQDNSTASTATGVGPDVFFRMLSTGDIFQALNEFWAEVLKDLPALNRAGTDAVESRKIFETWVKQYQRVFDRLVGPPVSKTAEEMTASWLNTIQMHQASLELMWNPWAQAIPRYREQFEKFLKGDVDALFKARSIWREVYDDTLGKIFRMPAFGLTKAHSERMRRSYDAFMQLGYSLPHFYEILYKTGLNALQEVFDKVLKLELEEITPETSRQLYQIWWTTNEDAFFELFKSPEFSNAMAEALDHLLRLKKRLDELTAEWCKALSIPTIREYDELSLAVHELRRKVRFMHKTIEDLQKKVEEVS